MSIGRIEAEADLARFIDEQLRQHGKLSFNEISGLIPYDRLPTPITARASHTTDVTAATATAYELGVDSPFDGVFETVDYVAESIVTAGGPFTITRGGIWKLGGVVKWAGSATGIRRIRLLESGTPFSDQDFVKWPTSGAAFGQFFTWEGPLEKDNSISLDVYQSSGGDLDMQFAYMLARFVGRTPS